MSAGAIVYRADLQTDRYDLVRAAPLWQLLTDPVPRGLSDPQTFGDEPRHAVAGRAGRRGAARAAGRRRRSASGQRVPRDGRTGDRAQRRRVGAGVVSGDGEGLVDLATIGALDGSGVVLYAATFADDPARLAQEIAQPNSVLVVTDSNRKRARRWTGVREQPRARPSGSTQTRVDRRRERQPASTCSPTQGTDSQTVVQTPGVAVSTSRYGDPGFYEPEYRGTRAFDGDTDHAVAGRRARQGDRSSSCASTSTSPSPPTRSTWCNRWSGRTQRYLTQVELSFDGGAPITVDLDDASRTSDGQTVTFPSQTFRRLDLTIADTNVGDESAQPFSNSVGFAEIRLQDDAPGSEYVRADEIVRMPTDLVDAAGSAAADRPLVYQMTRLRTVVVPPHFSQDEVALVRRFRVPDAAPSRLRGTARLATDAPDDVLDAVLGIPAATAGGITVTSSQHLPARPPVARLVGVRRRPVDRVEHRLRRAGRSVGRRGDARPGHLRPPRPAGRRRRQALGADAAAHRRGRRVAHGRRARDRPTRGGRATRSTVPVQFAPLTGIRRAGHGHRACVRSTRSTTTSA